MKLELLAGGLILAVVCFLGGALFSDRLSDRGAQPEAADTAAVDAASDEPQTARREEPPRERRSRSSDSAGSEDEIERLRAELEQRDELIEELRGALQELEDGREAEDGDAGREHRRMQRWDRIQEALSPVLDVVAKMDEDGSDQLRLGSHLIAELKQLTSEQYAEIVAFDADEKDPEILDSIRAVMIEALIFSPAASPVRDEYMSRLLDRAYTGAYSDVFTEDALDRISFSTPPGVDRYQRLIAPLDEDVRGRFIDLASHRLHVGPTEPLQVDGARFLARSTDPRATEELIIAFGRKNVDAWIRLAVLEGLASRAATDDRVLGFLRDSEANEPQREIRVRMKEVIDAVDAVELNRR